MLYRKLIEDQLEKQGTVVSDGTRNYSFLQLHQETMRYYAYLTATGVEKGDRVLIVDYDPIRTLFILLACIAGGFIFVPLNRQTDRETKDEIILDCQPKRIIDGTQELALPEKYHIQRPLCSDNTAVYLIYTSGTEGIPKGVVAQQKQILFCCQSINKRLQNTAQDRILCSLPLSFDYGLYQIFLALLSGSTLYLNQGNTIQEIPYLLSQWKITALPLVPSAANLMVRARLLRNSDAFSLRYICFTGEILPETLIQELKKALPDTQLIPMYGLTECKRVSIMPAGREDKVLAGSCGLPLEGITVYLKDPSPDTGIGELIVEGPNVMSYWNTTDWESKKFFTNPLNGQRKLYTGDYFRIDEDGFLYFCGRKSDILKICGYRISTIWLENRVKKISGVLEVAVLGIPDVLTGERAVLFLYLKDSSVKDSVIEAMHKLPSYLQSSKIYFWTNPLPRNANGKIDRRKLKFWIEGQS